jgi:ADP-heptose:LPS heptosyltransferase
MGGVFLSKSGVDCMGSQSVVVFMQNKPFLGAQIVQIPFFHFIRSLYPDHKIIGIAPEKSSYVLKYYGYLDEEWNYPVKGNIPYLIKLAFRAKGYHPQIVFQHRKHSLKTSVAARIAAGRHVPVTGFKGDLTRLFFSREIPFNFNAYMADVYLSLIGKNLAEFHQEIQATSPEKEKKITVIPAGSYEYKKYPLEKYVEIADAFSGEYTIHFILGPDMDTERDFLRSMENRFHIHFGKSLKEVEQVIRTSALVIANDCGPSHFAHIYNIPRITLFAANWDVKQWFYSSENSRYLYSESREEIHTIPVRKVIETAGELLKVQSVGR